MKKYIPNFLTSMNILSGSLAVLFAFQGADYIWYASLLVFVGAIFDFFDGMSARLLNVSSNIGKELDSLADMVSFGMAPAVIMYQTLVLSQTGEYSNFASLSFSQILIASIAMIIVIFSGIRLAKFNVDTRQTESFIGLATPANALVIISFPLILKFHPENILAVLISNTYFLIGLSIFLSLMLVAEYPMFSLKFKNLSFTKNKIRFIFLASVVLLGIFMQFAALPLIILIYILLSGIDTYILKKTEK